MKRIICFIGLALAASCALAQVQPNPNDKKPVEVKKEVIVPPQPTLTEAETYHLRLINLEFQTMQEHQTQLQAEATQFLQQIEKEHPGYSLNFQNGQIFQKPPAVPEAPEPKK